MWKSTDSTPRPTGSIWNKITAPNLGTAIVVREYSSALGSFVTKQAPVYPNDQTANFTLDPTGGGRNIQPEHYMFSIMWLQKLLVMVTTTLLL
jgi:hypothetical protein